MALLPAPPPPFTPHCNPQQSVVVRAEMDGTLFVSGHYRDELSPADAESCTIRVAAAEPPAGSSSFSPFSRGAHRGPDSVLSVDGWLPMGQQEGFEVLLFLPGYNTSCQYSMQVCGGVGWGAGPAGRSPDRFHIPPQGTTSGGAHLAVVRGGGI